MRRPAVSLVLWLGAVPLWGQPSIKPLLTEPTEKLVITQRFRDWRGIALSGNTIVAGHQNANGGLYAFDATTGTLKWVFRPPSPSEHVFSAPVIAGDTVIAGFSGDKVIAVSLTTGKELWRADAEWPNERLTPTIPVSGGLAFIRNREMDARRLTALDIATGKEKWRAADLSSQPVVRDGKVYSAGAKLVALDAETGREIWSYAIKGSASRLLASSNAIYVVGYTLIGVDRLTGRELWKPQELSNQSEGRTSLFDLTNLVEAGPFVVGVGAVGLVAFDKTSGKRAWDLATRNDTYQISAAGNIVYFQDRAAENTSPVRLSALDVSSRKVVWSYSRKANSSWPFGSLTPIDGGLWVTGCATLLKLQ